jgi:hypothetical protein
MIRSANTSRNTVDVEGQSVRLSPNVELAELTHEFILMQRSQGIIIVFVRHIPVSPSPSANGNVPAS